MQTHSTTIPTLFFASAIFIFYLLIFPSAPESMFNDPDTYWHLASGDLIRNLGALPEHDTWSFTAGNERWYNIAWAWDVMASTIYKHGGWSGLVMVNSITISLMLALVFANCLIHTRDGISAFFATLIFSAILCSSAIRPYQASALFIAGFLLLLTQVFHERISKCWLLAIPVLMVAWVNLHGGFIVAFALFGLLGLDALLDKRWAMVMALVATALASSLACLLNPYGIDIVYGALRTLTSKAGTVVQEWQPFAFSFRNITTYYLLLFLSLVMMRPLPLARSEKWIAYVWLALGLASIRNFAIFGIVSAPLLAVGLRHTICARPEKIPARHALVEYLCSAGNRMIHSRIAVAALMGIAAALSVAMFTPPAQRLYGNEHLYPVPELAEEIDYIQEHAPHAKLLNSYNLGGPLIFLTHGAIPVWIDGRAETAYPNQLISDYITFSKASQGWAELIDNYHLDGAIIVNTDPMTIDRLSSRKGWHIAFIGKTATVFIRDKPNP